MRIKRIRGRSMLDTLRKVKQELGENAVILDSERISENGVDYYEVLAAIEEEEVPTERKAPKSDFLSKEKYEPSFSPHQIFSELREIKELLQSMTNPKVELRQEVKALRLGIPPLMVKEIIAEKKDLTLFVKERCEIKGVNPTSRFKVFIGDPATGKTSVVFKIAFKFKEEQRGSLLVVSVDNYKVGGREQFHKLSQLLGIPYLWSDWDDLINNLPTLKREFDYILVDTPGLGKKFLLEELQEIIKDLPDFRFTWVVKALDEGNYNLELWQRLKVYPVDEVILTFVDRIKTGGPLFWLLEEEIPLPSYFSTGERIPEDLMRVQPNDLISLFLTGIKENSKD